MTGPIGVVLERPSGPDRAAGKPLAGDMGDLLRRVFAHHGVDVDRDCVVTYAASTKADLDALERLRANGASAEERDAWLNDPILRAQRIEIVRPHAERLQAELAGCTKTLCCGAMAVAAVYPLDHIPSHYHKKRGHGVLSTWGTPPKLLVPTYSLQQIWSAPDYARDFYWDIQKIVSQDAPHDAPDVETKVMGSLEETRYWLEQLCGASIIGADIETEPAVDPCTLPDDERKRHTLDPRRARIASIGFGAMLRADGRTGLTVLIPRHLLYPKNQYLCGLLAHYLGPRSPWQGTVVWQNAIFDLQHLREYLDAWPFHPRLGDTLLMSYSLDERPIGRFGVHSLKDMARLRFDLDYGFAWESFLALPEEERPYQQLYAYNGIDCFATARMYEIFRAEMAQEPGLEQMVDGLLIPATKALAQVARKGVLIDQDYLRAYRTTLDGLIAGRKAALVAYAAQRGVQSFDPSSAQQVARFLFCTLGLEMPRIGGKKGKKVGAWSSQKLVLDKVRRQCDDEQKTFLDNLIAYRLYDKTQSVYTTGLLKEVSTDGRIHPNLWLAGTTTGRLSSSAPNLQNQPIHTGKDIRRAFIAPEGYSLIEADHKNLELRVAAYFSQEPVLVEAFQRNADLHREVAARVFGKPIEQVTDHERFLAKAVNFGLIFGRSAEALAEGREMDEFEARGGTRWTIDAARKFHDDYLNRMPVLKEWIRQHVKRTFELKMTVTPYGRRRRFPLITPYMKGDIERQAVNTVIQSTASDITLEGLIRLVDALPSGAWVIMTIHDALLVEARDDLVPYVTSLMREIMEHPSLPDRGVPWHVDIHTAKNWADIKN